MRLSQQIREYIKCPQFGDAEYGRWGALPYQVRLLIKKICDQCDVYEDAADKFAKENEYLKRANKELKFALGLKEPILDKEEKEYLEAVIKPFRERVKSISKIKDFYDSIYEFIYIDFKNLEYLELPSFEKNTMYKGMELDKEYTLKELGLFEGE